MERVRRMSGRWRSMTVGPAAIIAALLGACGDDDAMPSDAGIDAGPRAMVRFTVGPEDREAQVYVPEADGPMPLLVLLHGYTASAVVQDGYFRTTQRARERGFALLLPDGTFDDSGNRFWNALPGFGGRRADIDDVAWLLALVDEVLERFEVDSERVYLFGHSNGGFMSYRLACEASDRFAALASLAGSSYPDEADCTPSSPVSVLQIHGDADDTIFYDGATEYPGAVELVERWSRYDGCDPTTSMGEALDWDGVVDGPETEVTRWSGCDAGSGVELWTMRGGGHLPAPTDEGVDATLDWLFAR